MNLPVIDNDTRFDYVQYENLSLYQIWKESGLTLSMFVDLSKELIDSMYLAEKLKKILTQG